jgi:hypothetical protein
MKRRRAKNKAKKVVDKSNADNDTNSTVKKNRKSSLNRISEDENVKLDTKKTNENIDKSIKLTSDDIGGTRGNSISSSSSGSKTTKTVKKVIQTNDQYSNESFSNEDTTSSSISTNSNEINVGKSGNDSHKANYLFIELKLISIDAKCIDYMPLEQRFLCINSANSLTSHIEKFIINKMKLNNQLFDVSVLVFIHFIFYIMHIYKLFL